MKNRLVNHDKWTWIKIKVKFLIKFIIFFLWSCPIFALENGFDGLKGDWGNSNFINPPYSRKLKEAFIRKAFEESKKGKLCLLLLLPVSTSTRIFHEIIYPNAELRFIKGRIKFLANGEINEKYKSGQMDSMIVIFRGNKFVEKKWMNLK